MHNQLNKADELPAANADKPRYAIYIQETGGTVEYIGIKHVGRSAVNLHLKGNHAVQDINEEDIFVK